MSFSRATGGRRPDAAPLLIATMPCLRKRRGRLGRSFVFDVETRVMVPSLHVPKWTPFSLFVPYASADADDDDNWWQIQRSSSGHFIRGRRIPKSTEAISSNLFIMERIPRSEAIGSSMSLGSFQFEALVCKPRWEWDSCIDSWQCQLLPSSSYIHERCTGSAIAAMRSALDGIGTYCLDIVSYTWRKVGDWTVPFRGRVEYLLESKLWFGLTAEAQA
ncbi:hypothetical protein SORBI_3004G296750 [Sorghum bicolor]|uniref:Uncharacterized protein n=1 Tax=Sorghum bicolor TaxID=4558 RepID=A0A1Z5RQP4_SORBI|nr:hypothetical protein SORBI_3004G296750 [Sorghum bicolor]